MATTLPECSNLFGRLVTGFNKADIAQWYVAEGWQSRASSWTDFELSTPWATLVLEGTRDILLHGCVLPERIQEVLAPLQRRGIAYEIEHYDEDESLLASYSKSLT